MRGISRLLGSRELTDVHIKCGDVVIPAHKNILCAQSETLRVALSSSSSFLEGKEGVYTVQETHMNPNILTDVIRWMYLNEIEDMSTKLFDLLEAAEYFQIADLKGKSREI
jgi:hypothetical protein